MSDVIVLEEQQNIINENLGNLAQLHVGPLINVLKQTGYQGGKRGGTIIYPAGEKFAKSYGYQIGSTSEIVNIGVLKDGIKTLRKAFKTHEGARGFAVYIGDQAVMFGTTDSGTLAGASRSGKLAYDLTPFEEKWKELHVKGYKGWGELRIPPTTTIKDRESSEWEGSKSITKVRKYYGDMIDTATLAGILDKIVTIGKELNLPVTAKLVMGDVIGYEKRKERYSLAQIGAGAKDLRTRLAIYKNQKNPTVDTIEDFVKMSLENPGKSVQFAGTTYKLVQASYDKIGVIDLLSGKSFTTDYKSVDPGSTDSLTMTYRYDRSSNQLVPIKATWYDRRDPANKYKRQETVLDAKGYLINEIGIRKLDKSVVIPKLLELFKASQYERLKLAIGSLKKMGADWPELDTIQNSVNVELAKKNAT